jgi:hypothetical protein
LRVAAREKHVRSPGQAKDPAYLSHARIARSIAGKLSIRVHEWLFRTIAIRNGGDRDATSTPIVVCAVDAAVHANPAAAVPLCSGDEIRLLLELAEARRDRHCLGNADEMNA